MAAAGPGAAVTRAVAVTSLVVPGRDRERGRVAAKLMLSNPAVEAPLESELTVRSSAPDWTVIVVLTVTVSPTCALAGADVTAADQSCGGTSLSRIST